MHTTTFFLKEKKKKQPKKPEEPCPVFHCSSIQINNAAQRCIKLAGSLRGPQLILIELLY